MCYNTLMEKRIKEYEKFIKEAAKHPTPELKAYHNEMVRNFQHERAIHLAIMLFFIAITLIVMVGAAFSIAFATIPFAITVSILAALLFILSAILGLCNSAYAATIKTRKKSEVQTNAN